MEQTSTRFPQVSDILEKQHRCIEQLFLTATSDPDIVDTTGYDQFRATILRHIAIEENVVLPLLRKHLPGGFPMELQLRMEHDAIAALCVLPPKSTVIFSLQGLIIRHNRLEEAHGTLYDLLDDCARREEEAEVCRQLTDFQQTVPPKYISNPLAYEYARRAVARAGYEQEVLIEEGKNARIDL